MVGYKLTYVINFNQDAIRTIEFDYVKVKLHPDQLKFISNISKRLCGLIDAPKIAIRGIICSALQDWQINNNKNISETPNFSCQERLVAAKEIFDCAKKKLQEVLSNPDEKSDLNMLDIVFERAFKQYMEFLQRIKY